MSKRLLVAALVTGLAWFCLRPCSFIAGAAAATHEEAGYAGLEFYGSSLISRSELEKEARLKAGADLETTLKAAARLKERLDARHIQANIDVASEGDKLYLAIDVMETGAGTVGRKLTSPHKVYLTNDMAMNVLDEMSVRAQKLADEGRPLTANYEDGIKFFSDEPMNQLVKKELTYVPPIRRELMQLIASDPDPVRRSKAVELLNWDPHPVQNCYDLLPVMEDGAPQVRDKVDRYIYPRLGLLPDNFPIQDLIEAYSRQLNRPSHLDRTQALQGLLAIVKGHPFAIGAVKVADEDKLKQLESMSLLSSIKQPARQLLDAFQHMPELPKPKKVRQINEF